MGEGWIEVRVESEVDAAELLGLLGDPESAGAWQENGLIRLYWRADRWRPELLPELRDALRRLGQEPGPTALQAESLPDRDWNAIWARLVKPIRIGRRVVVRPSWEPAPLQPGDIELVIDPKQAFGSGHHATTRLLIERLEERVRGGERLLDVGTGSGILAMVALRLGAASAVGIDCDAVAIDCAREYAARNGFGPELELRAQALDDTIADTMNDTAAGRAGFTLVLANLDRGTLLGSAVVLTRAAAPDGALLLSGILAEDEAEIAAVLAREGWVVWDRRGRDGWLALELGRTGLSAASMQPAVARVHQINRSDGGVPKLPVPEACITVEGVQGDRQRSLAIHGGRDRAVCLYSLERIEALQREGHRVAPGSAGENLTLAGLDWARLRPGSRLRIGETVRLEITSYTAPCSLNARWFRDGDFTRISQKRHPGWSRLYARVLAEGTVRAGDRVVVENAK